MAKGDRTENGTGRPQRAYGGASVDERAEVMRQGLTDEEIAARNVIPTTAPDGTPHRIIAEEYFSENDTATHWKPTSPDEPGPSASEPLKPGVLREGKKITDRIPIKLGLEKLTANNPDYWGLASVMTEEEAALTKHMKVRVPETLAQVAKGAGLSEEEAQRILDDLSIKGIIEYNWENLDGRNPEHEKRYVLPMFVPGSAEFTVMNQRQMEEHPEIGTFFERMTYLPLTVATKMVPPGGAGIGMHVIPVEYAIRQQNSSASVEHLSHWLKKYDRYAAGSCSCAVAERARGDNGGRDPQNWCIGVGDMADYLAETGKGHFITYDEVIDILLLAERNGYVHQITNIDGEDKIFAICNCDVSVCYALRTSQLFNTPNMSASAYRAHVDEEKCVACAGCVEVCPAGAVQLGQKLPTSTGKLEYPKQPLPDALSWGEDDWDPDYKTNNRIECHDTGTAPCKVACPAHVSVQGYLRMAAQGRYREALALIKKENPFPAVCGRVCNKRCEAACTRGTVDEAVAIDDVKKFVAQKDLEAEHRYIPEPTIPSTRGRLPEKVAIIGAGPAGLTCAYYLADMGYNPVVFEKNARPGGMLTYGIPSYKLQKDVVEAEIDIMRQMGVEIRCGVEVGRDVTLAELREQGFAAFYLAIGCQGGRRAGIPGEDAADVLTAVEFLRNALEDPAYEVDGRTVVVGGGNVAIDAARVSVRCGSNEVTMVSLEQRSEMPALPHEIAEAEQDGVTILNGRGPARVELDEDGKVCGVSFKRCTRVRTKRRSSPASMWFFPSDRQSNGATCSTEAPSRSDRVVAWRQTRKRTRRRNPTCSSVETCTPGPSSPSMPLPPVTRRPSACIASCKRARRLPFRATSATTWSSTRTTSRSIQTATTTPAARYRPASASSASCTTGTTPTSPSLRSRSASKRHAASSAAPPSSTQTSASAAGSARHAASSTPSTSRATCPRPAACGRARTRSRPSSPTQPSAASASSRVNSAGRGEACTSSASCFT